jgi:hypothetical protein
MLIWPEGQGWPQYIGALVILDGGGCSTPMAPFCSVRCATPSIDGCTWSTLPSVPVLAWPRSPGGGLATTVRRAGLLVARPSARFNGDVGAVRYRVVRWLRSTRRSSPLIIVVVAVLGSVPLELAAGARRTATAPARYLSALEEPPDVIAYQEEGPSFQRQIAALPAIRAVRSVTFVFGAITPGGVDQVLDGVVFAGSTEAVGDRLVSGREPDPGRRGEFVASADYAKENGLSIGDSVHLYTLTLEQVAERGFTGEAPGGPTLDAVLVGLIDGPARLSDPTGVAVLGISLLDDARIGTSGSVHAIAVTDGASIDELRAELDGIDGAKVLRLETAAVIASETRRAVKAQAIGLWILAGLAGLITIAALGQLLTRHTRLSTAETSILSSVGVTRARLTGEAAARAGIIVAVAAALAAAVAFSASGVFPFGFVRQIEPHPGAHGDALVLAAGTALVVLGLVGWFAVTSRFRRSGGPSRRAGGVDAIAARCRTSAMATGVRLPSRRATPRRSGPGSAAPA